MAAIFQNRTVSMILMVPDITVRTPLLSSSPVINKVNRLDIDQSSNIDSTSSMPVYHGSIVRIEQHIDDENTSDLIIRVPNFQYLSLPSYSTDNKQSTIVKRRAPICPILSSNNQFNSLDLSNTTDNVNKSNLSQTRGVTSTNRLATGLRSLSRVFAYNCKSKRSSTINEINILPTLPDVEVMKEKLDLPITSKKSTEHENSTTSSKPKLITPKILFIKGKHLKIKNKSSLPSPISVDTQIDHQNNRKIPSTIITTHYSDVSKGHSPKKTSFIEPFIEKNDSIRQINRIEQNVDNEQQNKSIELNYEVDQQLAAIAQLISDVPLSSIDADSLSTHRYSTISAILPDKQNSTTDNDTEEVSLSEQIASILFPTSTGISYDFDKKQAASIIHEVSSKPHRPFRIQTSILQPDISVIRVGTSNLTTGTDRLLPGEQLFNKETDSITNNQIDIEQIQSDNNRIGQHSSTIIHSDEETFTECYEVTYQIDPQYQNQQEEITNQKFVPTEINFESYENRDLMSTVTTWLPFIPQNEYEQIKHDNCTSQNERKLKKIEKTKHNFENLDTSSAEQQILTSNIRRIKFQSIDDLSRTSNDQTSTYQSESIYVSSSSENSSQHCTLQRSNSYNGLGIDLSTYMETHREHFIHQVEELSPGKHTGLKENDRILCINGTPVIDEDYTVVLQLIQHGLQTDTLDFDVITNNAYEEFKSHIGQLYQ
ncbi:unnamed protein product [Rotaria magnacalcarata]|uniref:PDZ domain-containing protein n=1 Tax=Rotaria magnacalcarata TaxID=392030 RepID=A0A818XMN6_9BILA|nr:unnamed protein product [Rotaria magnacalcarata]CAF2143949.1 unnamed protein product [Rotaria magnacalcarata]CAF3740748.1 unnamed protein product [Rotaria magnacalcarata]CAF3742126.1 unnamed protein product [Rotaria magnacalcarata]